MSMTHLTISKTGAVNIAVIRRIAKDLYGLDVHNMTYDMDQEEISLDVDINSQADLANISMLIENHVETEGWEKSDERYKEDLYATNSKLESTTYYRDKDVADVLSGKVRQVVYNYSSTGLLIGNTEYIFDKQGNILSKEMEEYFEETLPNGKRRRVTRVTEL